MLKEFDHQPGKLAGWQDLRLWFVGLAASLMLLNLLMLWRSNEPDTFNTQILLWLAVGSLLWEKRQTLTWRSSSWASVLGLLLIGFVFARTYSPAGYQLVISPLLSGLGVFLLASGGQSLRSYWRELIILTLPIVSQIVGFGLELIDLPTRTAEFSAYLLWAVGFEVQRRGVFILQPTGTVEVYAACSGVGSVIQMLNLAVVFFLLFRTTWPQKVICLLVAITIGFITNGIRVAIMALLVAYSNRQAFDFWHGGQGSLIFSVISTLLLVGFCWLAFLRQPPE